MGQHYSKLIKKTTIVASPSSTVAWILVCLLLVSCSDRPWNNPYPVDEDGANILYTTFEERPKHLDPVQSYSSNEVEFTGQIYEPPLEYHYLKRPYQLQPLAAAEMPVPVYLDRTGRELPPGAAIEDIAFSVYRIRIRPGINYQPHPAFARDETGKLRYHQLGATELEQINELRDFPLTGFRELKAADYVYQIKRLAHPKLHSPILSLMSEYIDGLKEYSDRLAREYKTLQEDSQQPVYLDLTSFDFPGVRIIDDYSYEIRIRGKYPQFLYWLAMPFFAPVPAEADRFYTQPGMKEKNITLDWYPVGTGPYMLTVNNPNREMIMERNPNFRGEPYPSDGEPGDREAGLLEDAGKTMPFLDKVVFKLEKEAIPSWNKFLQGYYDSSGISSDSFDQAVKISADGEASLTPEMRDKGITLTTSIATSSYYIGFNMLDEVVGGDSERARKLRQAISIAVDYEEFISIFTNGRGIAAQGPVPPGIFGYREGEQGVNEVVYEWDGKEPRRRKIEDARRLMEEAGYKDGIDPATGTGLILYFDTPMSSGPGTKPYLDWMRKQFGKLNIQLVFRNTDYNRFQEKMLKGNAQIFRWGWNADYPDPENFLFLLYGPNSRAKYQGENAANYRNTRFDALFEQMKNMDNGPRRQQLIDSMVRLLRRDAPWLWGFHPKGFGLRHAWVKNSKPNHMANNTLKYKRIDPALRARLRAEWNRPVLWPALLATLVLLASIVPAVISYRRRERMAIK